MSRWRTILLTTASLALASTAGFLTSQVFAAGSQTPAKTVTITLTNGATGPTGPTGPQGPAGTSSCPQGFSAGELVINHPGGQTVIWTCLQD
jgi:hypothetical protein